MDVHIATNDVIPANTECAGGDPLIPLPPGIVANEAPPQVPSYRLDINTNPIPFGAPVRPMALFGLAVPTQWTGGYINKSMADLTEVFSQYQTLPVIPGTFADWDIYAGNYTGVQPGWQYDPIPSETWDYYWAFAGRVSFAPTFDGCVPIFRYYVSSHVVNQDPVTLEIDSDGDTTPDTFPVWPAIQIDETYIVAYNDDDGDTLVDEDPLDTVDNDGDTVVDEDLPGLDNDGDTLWDEDPEDTVDNDGDTLVDEDAVDDPPADGSRQIWWTPDIDGLGNGEMVKQININTPFVGTETWQLESVGP
jgi:hypothetical protein